MADRVLAVNAYTTFTLLDAELEGHGWRTDAAAVLNVTSGDGATDGDGGGGDGGDDSGGSDSDAADGACDGSVVVELELDNTAIDDVPAHADRLDLSPAEAREFAAELESQADRVEE